MAQRAHATEEKEYILLDTLRIFKQEQIEHLEPRRKDGHVYTINQGKSTLRAIAITLRDEDEILRSGFAGHIVAEYPEMALRYNIAYGMIEQAFQIVGGPRPLLVYRGEELLGIMNFVWQTAVGVIPAKRTEANQLRVEKVSGEKLPTIVTIREHLDEIRFATDEVLAERPWWLRKRNEEAV
jgi:hypothetical protein